MKVNNRDVRGEDKRKDNRMGRRDTRERKSKQIQMTEKRNRKDCDRST